jgi:hypothetical protein
MDLLGPQCNEDDAFKKQSRLHQSAYRASTLKVSYDTHGNVLQEADAAKGLNFYDKYEVFAAVKERRRKYAKPLYANLLRSEHIPFNVFVPFRTERDLFAAVATEAFGVKVAKAKCIKIEYAPLPASDYLDDNTSFDVFCDCEDERGNDVFLGIEVKYTEREYAFGVKERKYCLDPASPYHRKTSLYRAGVLAELKTDSFRQIWRNHLLAEALFCKKKPTCRDYRSIVLYPSGNDHIDSVVSQYKAFLCDERAESFSAITFEDFFALIDKHARSSNVQEWVAYLRRRYVSVDP